MEWTEWPLLHSIFPGPCSSSAIEETQRRDSEVDQAVFRACKRLLEENVDEPFLPTWGFRVLWICRKERGGRRLMIITEFRPQSRQKGRGFGPVPTVDVDTITRQLDLALVCSRFKIWNFFMF